MLHSDHDWCTKSNMTRQAVATESAAAAWRSIAAPWINRLLAVADVMLALGCARVPVVFVHILESKCGDAWRERIVECREALALLAMIGAADPPAWIELLHIDFRCTNVPHIVKRGDPISPSFWVSFNFRKSAEEPVNDSVRFAYFFLPYGPAYAPSAALIQAQQAVIAQCTPAMRRTLAAYPRFALDIRFQPPPKQTDAFVLTYVENVRTLVRALARLAPAALNASERSDDDWASRFPFKPANVELDVSELSLSPSVAAVVADILACGVSLGPAIDLGSDATPLSDLDVDELAPIVLALTDHKTFQGARTHRFATVSRKLRVGYGEDAFDLGDDDVFVGGTDNARAEAVLSAFVASQDIDELYLREVFSIGSATDIHRKWQWFAYALLSYESTATMSSLRIDDLGFGAGSSAAIHQVLAARSPASLLLKHAVQGSGPVLSRVTTLAAVGDGDEALSAALPAGTVLEVNPLDEMQSAPRRIVLAKDQVVRVLQSRGADFDVLVPGYGHCVVPRVAATRVLRTPLEGVQSSLARGYAGTIRSLEVSLTLRTDASRLVPMITYLGPTLRELKLFGAIHTDRPTLCAILDACPLLETLVLFHVGAGVETDVLAAFDRPSCCLSRVSLFGVTPSPETLRYVQTLGNPSSALASKLQHAMFFPARGLTFDGPLVAAFIDALGRNDRLESLTLGLGPALAAKYRRALMQFHKQRLPHMDAPVPLVNQLAFLSVLRRHAHPDRPQKRQRRASTELERLDRGVVSLIFAFAAERKVRSICVEP